MELNNYAPVIIPTLNRYDHFVRCIQSLAKCTDASETDLIIGLDFPPSDKYVDGYKRIKEYCDKINKKCIVDETLEEAINDAYKNAKDGDVVLLSPACASWDQYKECEVRGKEFKDKVQELKISMK